MSPETMLPPAVAGPVVGDPEEDLSIVPPEALPDLEQFPIDDGKPMDNIFTEKQSVLLRRTPYVSWKGPGPGRTYQFFANVGFRYAVDQPTLAPDLMLSLDVVPGQDLSRRENRSYFSWLRGKQPEFVLEIVSDQRGDETGYKMSHYARAGILYYAVFDPEDVLGSGVLRCWRLVVGEYQPMQEPFYFPQIGLGLALWEGEFEGVTRTWLRWCDSQGLFLPYDTERIALAEDRAAKAEDRAAKAEDRAAKAEDRAAKAEELAQRLAARLRELGIEP